ncbi:MAG TPA: SCO family protein [Puia sp.]|jgi:protein SCO1/2|nr:SCO family protein [Puia sp.]
MRRSKKGQWFVLAVLVLPLLSFGILRIKDTFFPTLSYYGDNFLESAKAKAIRIGPFHFMNQDGKETDSSFTSGKVWVACYFFTRCPSICPRMITGMGDVQTKYKDDDRLRMVSFTVDPMHDTPPVLHQYATERDIDSRQWRLLTGEKKDLYRFAREDLKLDASDGDGGPTDFIHSDRLVLIDRDNYVRGYYDGTEPAEVRQLMRDIDKLLNTNH